MKNLLFTAFLTTMILGCKDKVKEVATERDDTVETSTKIERQGTWETLELEDWQAFKGGDVPKFWIEEEGAIIFQPPTAEEREDESGNRQSFNIVTKKEYESFVLSLEWKISEAGNSGIMWGVSEDEQYKEPYQTGLEIQVLDNEKHPDGKNGTSHQAGALYDLVSPAKDVTKPIGEWNTAVITIDHSTNKGSSMLNGVEVASFPVGGDELKALLKGSKFETWDGFAGYKKGKIALQDHGDIVAFRNIEIKEL